MFKSFTESQKKGLLNYKYKGTDNSFIYVNITNPIYVSISEKLPLWLAPNLITFSGYIAMFIAYILNYYYSPDCKSDTIPSWLYIYNGLAIIFYQALDAIDGKQARRTNTSSPLGLLFDHGFDSINTITLTFLTATTVRMGLGFYTWLIAGISLILFYMNTLEEFYTGELVLPVFNGPNEGMWLIVFINWYNSIFGSNFWINKNIIFTTYQNNEIFAFFIINYVYIYI